MSHGAFGQAALLMTVVLLWCYMLRCVVLCWVVMWPSCIAFCCVLLFEMSFRCVASRCVALCSAVLYSVLQRCDM